MAPLRARDQEMQNEGGDSNVVKVCLLGDKEGKLLSRVMQDAVAAGGIPDPHQTESIHSSSSESEAPESRQQKRKMKTSITLQTLSSAKSNSSRHELHSEKRNRSSSSESEAPQSKQQRRKMKTSKMLQSVSSAESEESLKHELHSRKRTHSSSSESEAAQSKQQKRKMKTTKMTLSSTDSEDSSAEIKKLQMQLHRLMKKQKEKKNSKKTKKLLLTHDPSSDSSEPRTSTLKNQTDDLINQLNDIHTISCRELKLGRKYKLIDINVTEENGFYGHYKKATAKLQDKTKPSGYINVLMPKPVANLPPNIIAQMKSRAQNENPPYFTVNSVKARERSDAWSHTGVGSRTAS